MVIDQTRFPRDSIRRRERRSGFKISASWNLETGALVEYFKNPNVLKSSPRRHVVEETMTDFTAIETAMTEICNCAGQALHLLPC